MGNLCVNLTDDHLAVYSMFHTFHFLFILSENTRGKDSSKNLRDFIFLWIYLGFYFSLYRDFSQISGPFEIIFN